jgi:hypothetical protein
VQTKVKDRATLGSLEMMSRMMFCHVWPARLYGSLVPRLGFFTASWGKFADWILPEKKPMNLRRSVYFLPILSLCPSFAIPCPKLIPLLSHSCTLVAISLAQNGQSTSPHPSAPARSLLRPRERELYVLTEVWL